jgi:hypothetical protein
VGDLLVVIADHSDIIRDAQPGILNSMEHAKGMVSFAAKIAVGCSGKERTTRVAASALSIPSPLPHQPRIIIKGLLCKNLSVGG